MRSHLSRKLLSSCVATVAIAGCSGVNSQSVVPAHAVAQSRPLASDAEKSWMLPEAKNEDLLYVSSEYLFDTAVGYHVLVLSYASGKLVGTLKGFTGSGGECVDKQGNVFITDWRKGGASIVEFAHGGRTPIATLKDPPSHVACSVDRVTGNLAVANGASNVAIFTRARGVPTLYTDPSFKDYLFCAYDDKGNLFVDGLGNDGSNAVFAELPKGAHSFTDITLKYAIGTPGQLRAAHGELAIAGGSGAAIYRFTISGGSGTLVGTTQLNQPYGASIRSFWIQNYDVAVAYCCATSGPGVKLFAYPSGGKSKRAYQSGGIPYGTAISLAPSNGGRVR